jgi:hypothetical protein
MAGMTRSITSIIGAALLIPAVFLVAALFGATTLTGLVIAILGFNFGLVNLVIGATLIENFRHA